MSDDWARFVELFGRLRQAVADHPDRLPGLHKSDETVREIVSQIESLDAKFTNSTELKLVGSIPGVNPTFIRSWREYEEKYKHVVIDLFWNTFLGEEIDLGTRYEQRIENNSAEYAKASLKNLEQCIDNIDEMSYQEDRFDEDYLDLLRDGVRTWKIISANINIEGFLMRLDLVPKVLVPSAVSMSRPASRERGNVNFLYRNLEDAQMAFVCGIFAPSIVMVRSIVEDILRHNYPPFYGSDKVELAKMIKNAHGLPPSVPVQALDQIRIVANYLIHPIIDNETERRLAESIVARGQSLEKFNLHALRLTRRLIEGISRPHNETINR